MSETSTSFDLDQCLAAVESATASGKITPAAAVNLICWLTEPKFSQYVPAITEHIADEKWKKLDDVFWTTIPFGTGGRRGTMYPFGSNAINDRTIGESAQGLAAYVKLVKPAGPWSMALAYDNRHRSREFAELCAGIMVANGFTVWFIDEIRSTPELSLLVRYKKCDCGIMVTASHNPPSDNAVKVYWSSGAQLIPPHDEAVIEFVNQVDQIPRADFATAVKDGSVKLILEEIDEVLKTEEAKHSFPGPRDLKIIYSPLHGVGEANVTAILNEVGFHDLEIYAPHREPDGDFPNVPNHVSNPENAEVFTAIIKHAQQTGADLILATDPDADRMGAAAPVTLDNSGEWSTFNGNQLGVLLADFVLRKREEAGTLDANKFVVSTLVTTRMIERICKAYGVKFFGNNLVGFKWICSVVDAEGPSDFVFGTEESHGYLVGEYCRDKDGPVACMLMCELAAWCKAKGISLFEHLDDLYKKHGYHHESLINIAMQGSDGMKRMESLMQKFRSEPPKTLGGIPVTAVRDFSCGRRIFAEGTSEAMEGPTGNVLIFETAQEGNYVAARPSGTEPKVKFYMFTYVPADQISDLDQARSEMQDRITAYSADMQAFAASIS